MELYGSCGCNTGSSPGLLLLLSYCSYALTEVSKNTVHTPGNHRQVKSRAYTAMKHSLKQSIWTALSPSAIPRECHPSLSRPACCWSYAFCAQQQLDVVEKQPQYLQEHLFCADPIFVCIQTIQKFLITSACHYPTYKTIQMLLWFHDNKSSFTTPAAGSKITLHQMVAVQGLLRQISVRSCGTLTV